MEKSVDRLFNKKLHGLESVPSVDAWNQIQDGLQEEKKPISWALIAASISLLLVAGTFAWMQQVQIEVPAEQAVVKLETPATNSVDHLDAPRMMTSASNENITAETETQRQHIVPVNSSLETEPSSLLLIAETQISIQSRIAHVDYRASSLDLNFYPMYVEDAKKDESKLKRAWNYAQKVKNGETKPLNLQKAKADLFAFAKSKIKSEESTPLNFD